MEQPIIAHLNIHYAHTDILNSLLLETLKRLCVAHNGHTVSNICKMLWQRICRMERDHRHVHVPFPTYLEKSVCTSRLCVLMSRPHHGIHWTVDTHCKYHTTCALHSTHIILLLQYYCFESDRFYCLDFKSLKKYMYSDRVHQDTCFMFLYWHIIHKVTVYLDNSF